MIGGANYLTNLSLAPGGGGRRESVVFVSSVLGPVTKYVAILIRYTSIAECPGLSPVPAEIEFAVCTCFL